MKKLLFLISIFFLSTVNAGGDNQYLQLEEPLVVFSLVKQVIEKRSLALDKIEEHLKTLISNYIQLYEHLGVLEKGNTYKESSLSPRLKALLQSVGRLMRVSLHITEHTKWNSMLDILREQDQRIKNIEVCMSELEALQNDIQQRLKEIHKKGSKVPKLVHKNTIVGILLALYNAKMDKLIAYYEDDTIRIWDLKTGQWTFGLGSAYKRIVFDLCTHGNTSSEYIVGLSESIELWNERERIWRSEKSLGDCCRALCTSPHNPSLLVSGHGNGAVRLWDIPSRQYIEDAVVHDDMVFALCITPKNFLVTSTLRGKMKIKRLAQDTRAYALDIGHEIVSIHSDPLNSDQVLVVGEGIELWDIEARKRVSAFGVGNKITSCAVKEFPYLIATGQENGVIKLWNGVTEKCLSRIEAHTGPLINLAFRGENQLISAGEDGTIKLWQLKDDEWLLLQVLVP